jgi:hypothetical protein
MKRVLLVTMGLIFVAGGYFGCLPADSPSTTGAAGTMGTGNTTGAAGTTGVAGDTGAAGTTGVAGDTGQGGAGNEQGTAGTGGGPQGTAGTTGGSGPAGTAGTTGGSGGSGAAGTTGGSGGPAGRGGAAGGAAGRGGASGSGPAGMGGSGPAGMGGGGNLMAVAAPLDGAMLLGPCGRDTEGSVCATINSGACPDQTIADTALRGVKTTDKTVTLGGTPGVTYTIQLRVQGEVESRNYTGGTDQSTSGSSPNLDGWRVGGSPASGNAYNVYMLRVTNPGATTSTTYYLNSLDPPGVENHTTYGLNYMTPTSGALAFTAQGGAMVRIVAADSNCSMIKNCGPNVSGSTCLAPITIQNVEPTSVAKNASFNFNTPYNGQWIVLTVKGVTQN